MKKYNDLTLIVLSFKIVNKNIVITYSDNSSKTQNERITLKKDLENVENRIKTTNGTLNFGNYTENGFKISFTFPL
jgi:signal transduction histidine kinase